MRISAKTFFDSIFTQLTHTNQDERRALAFILAEHYAGLKKSDIVVNKEIDQVIIPDQIFERLKHNEPVQYILGTAPFFGREFKVNPAVLIPRPETEELIDLIIKENIPSGRTIWDIGTGSGCIAISLAKELPGSKVYASDISMAALETARENAAFHQADIEFIRHDILKDLPLRNLNIIVSNPPYVTEAEKGMMHENVLNYEPPGALFVPNDEPLLFYSKIADIASQALLPGGLLYFEINENFGQKIQAVLNQKGFINTKILKDINGKDRIATGKKI
ncbi:MAG: peptide chain release factor N(5)-glutamine methyltransferase [Cytophagaceae bacterium]